MRRVGEVRVILGLAILTVYGSSAGAGDQAHDGSTTLHVLLTTAPELTAVSRAALIGEATAVWRRAGVHLVWDPGAGARPAAGALRILVIRDRRAIRRTMCSGSSSDSVKPLPFQSCRSIAPNDLLLNGGRLRWYLHRCRRIDAG